MNDETIGRVLRFYLAALAGLEKARATWRTARVEISSSDSHHTTWKIWYPVEKMEPRPVRRLRSEVRGR